MPCCERTASGAGRARDREPVLKSPAIENANEGGGALRVLGTGDAAGDAATARHTQRPGARRRATCSSRCTPSASAAARARARASSSRSCTPPRCCDSTEGIAHPGDARTTFGMSTVSYCHSSPLWAMALHRTRPPKRLLSRNHRTRPTQQPLLDEQERDASAASWPRCSAGRACADSGGALLGGRPMPLPGAKRRRRLDPRSESTGEQRRGIGAAPCGCGCGREPFLPFFLSRSSLASAPRRAMPKRCAWRAVATLPLCFICTAEGAAHSAPTTWTSSPTAATSCACSPNGDGGNDASSSRSCATSAATGRALAAAPLPAVIEPRSRRFGRLGSFHPSSSLAPAHGLSASQRRTAATNSSSSSSRPSALHRLVGATPARHAASGGRRGQWPGDVDGNSGKLSPFPLYRRATPARGAAHALRDAGTRAFDGGHADGGGVPARPASEHWPAAAGASRRAERRRRVHGSPARHHRGGGQGGAGLGLRASRTWSRRAQGCSAAEGSAQCDGHEMRDEPSPKLLLSVECEGVAR